MIDHAPRILAEQQAQRENIVMEDLERRSAPLLWAVYLAVLVLSLGSAAESAQAYIKHVGELAAQGEAFAQCLNGRTYKIDNVVVRCDVQERQLVAGIGGAR